MIIIQWILMLIREYISVNIVHVDILDHKYILVKIDDDLEIDTWKLVNILEEKYPRNTIPDPNIIHCTVFRNFR